MSARHRERYSSSLQKLSTIKPESCPRPAGIGVHHALESLSTKSRNNQSLPRVSLPDPLRSVSTLDSRTFARYGRIRRMASTLPGRQVGQSHLSSECTRIITHSWIICTFLTAQRHSVRGPHGPHFLYLPRTIDKVPRRLV